MLCHIIYLTFVKLSKERVIILPAVNDSSFCDLKMINMKLRLCLISMSYHAELYAAFPIALLYEEEHDKRPSAGYFLRNVGNMHAQTEV